MDQYNAIVAALLQEEQKRGSLLLPRLSGNVPQLADVGLWHGSFDVVPTPNLEENVVRMIVNPIPDVVETREGNTGEAGGERGSGEIIVTEGANAEGEMAAGPQDATAEQSAEGIEEWKDDFFTEFLGDDTGDVFTIGE